MSEMISFGTYVNCHTFVKFKYKGCKYVWEDTPKKDWFTVLEVKDVDTITCKQMPRTEFMEWIKSYKENGWYHILEFCSDNEAIS